MLFSLCCVVNLVPRHSVDELMLLVIAEYWPIHQPTAKGPINWAFERTGGRLFENVSPLYLASHRYTLNGDFALVFKSALWSSRHQSVPGR